MFHLEEILRRITHIESQQQENTRKIMAAIQNLTDAVTANTTGLHDLQVAVDAAVAKLGTPGTNDATLQALADAITANTATTAAQTARLNAAVTPTAPSPAP